jgi:hypothetical protein
VQLKGAVGVGYTFTHVLPVKMLVFNKKDLRIHLHSVTHPPILFCHWLPFSLASFSILYLLIDMISLNFKKLIELLFLPTDPPTREKYFYLYYFKELISKSSDTNLLSIIQ